MNERVTQFLHKPVLLKECISGLNIKPDGIYVDCTLGGAGHAKEILKNLSDNGVLIGIDQDAEALEAANTELKKTSNETGTKARVELVHRNFENIADIVEELEISGIDGMLMDIGVSSYQLDEGKRGFSYNHDERLDMRMNRDTALSAYEIVNQYSGKHLEEIIYKYGEERWSARIAYFITEERQTKPIETTGELVTVIKKAVPAEVRKDGPHPAKRTFQAIRIEVNNELGVLERAVREGFKLLNKGGRMCVITFHSLEDRIVKNEFASFIKGCQCPPEFPVCICGKKSEGKLINRKPIIADDGERKENPRARSAKLRIIERI